MSQYREQAIRDVAEEIVWSVQTVHEALRAGHDIVRYAVAQRERVLELEAKLQPPKQKLYEEGRCQICGWPLAQRLEDGCVPRSCGMRPRENSEEYFRYKERGEWLRKNHPEFLEAQLSDKEQVG